MVAWPLLLLICLLTLALSKRRKIRSWLRRQYYLRQIHSPASGSLISGHLHHFADRTQVRQRRREWMQLFPKIYKYDIGFIMSLVNVPHPDTAAIVFRSAFPKDSHYYGFLRSWLGDGLLTSNGQKWARDRRLLTNCFHFDILKTYMEKYMDAVGVMLHNWSGACQKGESVDVTASCTMLTLDVILRCAMGFESNCQVQGGDGGDNQAACYADSVVWLGREYVRRLCNILNHSDFYYFNFTAAGKEYRRRLETIHGMSERLIRERRTALAEQGGKPIEQCRDFLDVLLTVKDEDGQGLSDEEVRDQVDTFLFRGHDTTASAIMWTFYYLSKHDDLQERCRDEVREVLSDSTAIAHSHLSQLSYLTQFIKESMRISSPVPFVSRDVPEDTVIHDKLVPEGSTVELSIHDLHMAEDQWPDPLHFDPDRFSPEQCEARHPYAYVPFSAGPRNCIGQTFAMDEIKTGVAMALNNFSIRPDPTWPDPAWVPAMISRPDPNIKVLLEEV